MMLQLWAAIDILEGSVVTLVHGKVSRRTTWEENPLRYAERWQDEGAYGLHVIDLDSAFQKGSNRDMILQIIRKARVPVELGGGMRNRELVSEWLAAGAERVVVGTMAYKEPAVLMELIRKHGPEKIVVAADYKDGIITTSGWSENQGITLRDAVMGLEKKGVKNILTTSVGRDGTGSGPDLKTIDEICGLTKMNVLASGGIRDAKDLGALERAGAKGAILGRALYEETVRMSETREPTDGSC